VNKNILKRSLNEANTLRNSLRGKKPSQEEVSQLIEISSKCLQLSKDLDMEHGKGLSLDMLLYAQVAALDLKSASPKEYLELLPKVEEAEKVALSYNDAHLETRILETLANLFMRAEQYEQESRVIEKALVLSRTTPKVMALCDTYQRIINQIYERNPSNADAMVKFHTEYWSHYLWLREQPDFNRDAWILANRGQLYKIAIYVASIAGNPLNVGESDPENYKIAKEAYDEAIYIAELMNNSEFLCAAQAHKANMLHTKVNASDRAALLKDLQQLEDTYHPTNTELRDVIKLIQENGAKGSTQSTVHVVNNDSSA